MKKIVNLMVILSICGLSAQNGTGHTSAFTSFVNSFRSLDFNKNWTLKDMVPTWSLPKVSVPEVKLEDVLQKHEKEIGLGFGVLAGIGLLRKAYVSFYKKPKIGKEIADLTDRCNDYLRIKNDIGSAMIHLEGQLQSIAEKNNIVIKPVAKHVWSKEDRKFCVRDTYGEDCEARQSYEKALDAIPDAKLFKRVIKDLQGELNALNNNNSLLITKKRNLEDQL